MYGAMVPEAFWTSVSERSKTPYAQPAPGYFDGAATSIWTGLREGLVKTTMPFNAALGHA
jgi:hypothetical protein